jgi:ketosteroid isomerase-like protein
MVDALVEAMNRADWDAVEQFYAADVVMEYPQSEEVFRGVANVRATFEQYPGGLDDARLQTENVATEQPQYVITPMYTAVAVEGSGNRGTVTFRATYPDGSIWWVVIQYELEAERVAHSRVFFAPAFEPPDWRAPYREASTGAATRAS